MIESVSEDRLSERVGGRARQFRIDAACDSDSNGRNRKRRRRTRENERV